MNALLIFELEIDEVSRVEVLKGFGGLWSLVPTEFQNF